MSHLLSWKRGLVVLAALAVVPCVTAGDGVGESVAPGDPHRGPAGLFSLDEFARITGASVLAEESSSSALSGWSFGGFIDTAYTYNFNRPPNDAPATTGGVGPTYLGGPGENAGRVFDTEHNDFLLHSAQLSISKSATNDSWVGGQIVIMAGHDAKFIHSTGLNTSEDVDLTDAFILIRIPDDVRFFGGGELKLGKFETILGAEVINSKDNPNFSRSLAFGFAIPFVHVGALYSQDILKHRDSGKMMAGIDLGFVNSSAGLAEDNNEGKALLARVRVAPCEFISAHVATVVGNEPVAGSTANGNTRAVLDVVAEIRMPDSVPDVLKRLSFLLNYDFGGQENGDTQPGGSAKWAAFSGIAKYQVDKQWYVAFRGEAFRDSDGFAIGLSELQVPAGGGRPLVRTGKFAKDYMELTATLGYRPWENLLLRAEWRYDKADEDVYGSSHGGSSNHQNTLALDAVVTF